MCQERFLWKALKKKEFALPIFEQSKISCMMELKLVWDHDGVAEYFLTTMAQL